MLPTPTDGQQLFERATEYVMKFLVEHFPALEEVLPQTSSSPKEKSTVVPMSLLQRYEKYTDETIKILHDFMSDCNMTGQRQVRYSIRE